LRLLILSCLAILGILIPMRLAFLNEVILLERGQGERSTQSVYRRCEQLIADRGGDLLLQCLLHLLFLGMFVVAFRWGVESALDVLLGQSSWDRSDPETYAETMLAWFFDLKSWSFQLAIWIAVAFFGIVRFLTYIDQRIRMEGWEVELRLRSVGAAMED